MFIRNIPATTRRVLLAAALTFALALSSHAAIVHLTLQSQTGDFIGQGKNWDITYNSLNGATASASIQATTAGAPSRLDFVLNNGDLIGNSFSTLTFGTDKLGIAIQPGLYTNAERAPFATLGHAGLDVTFQNRGSNTLTGQFTVQAVGFYTDSLGTLRVNNFAATFEQHSGGGTPALFGTFTYSAGIAAVPETSSALAGMLAVGACASGLSRRNRRGAVRH